MWSTNIWHVCYKFKDYFANWWDHSRGYWKKDIPLKTTRHEKVSFCLLNSRSWWHQNEAWVQGFKWQIKSLLLCCFIKKCLYGQGINFTLCNASLFAGMGLVWMLWKRLSKAAMWILLLSPGAVQNTFMPQMFHGIDHSKDTSNWSWWCMVKRNCSPMSHTGNALG